jgi:outer membrane murein-binding lipoprotein Lpp
VVSEP